MRKKNDIYLKAAEHFFKAYKKKSNCGLCYHISQITGDLSYEQRAIKKIEKIFKNEHNRFHFGPYRDQETASQRLLALLFMHEIVNYKK